MKSLDNVLKPLGERISSPLYSTFLIAWSISNWKVFYITFFIPSDKLHGSKLCHVQALLTNLDHVLFYPLFATILFILVFPYIEKEVLKIWYKNKADRKKIVVERMEKSPVSGEEHRALLMKYVQRETELTDFFQIERTWLKEKADFVDERVLSDRRINGMEATIKQYQSHRKILDIFTGRWRLQVVNQDGVEQEHFYISSTDEYIVEGSGGKPKYRIAYFYYDEANKKAFILKEKVDDTYPQFLFNDLMWVDDNTYEGREFGITSPQGSPLKYISRSVIYRRSGATS